MTSNVSISVHLSNFRMLIPSFVQRLKEITIVCIKMKISRLYEIAGPGGFPKPTVWEKGECALRLMGTAGTGVGSWCNM